MNHVTHMNEQHVTTRIQMIHVATKESWYHVKESWHPMHARSRSDGCVNKDSPQHKQHSSTLFNTLQHSATLATLRNTLQHSATLCNTLQHTTILMHTDPTRVYSTLQHSATLCKNHIYESDPLLQQAELACKALQCRCTLQHAASTHYNTLQHTATNYSANACRSDSASVAARTRLQRTAEHCGTLQHV